METARAGRGEGYRRPGPRRIIETAEKIEQRAGRG
jgi:hypothetical protein